MTDPHPPPDPRSALATSSPAALSKRWILVAASALAGLAVAAAVVLRSGKCGGEPVIAPDVPRAEGRAIFPARFQLVAAMNMCPCGGRGDQSAECVCSAQKR